MRERRSESRLIGRDQELAHIVSLAEDPLTGAVLVTGPVGIGKSRLGEGVVVELTGRGWRGVGLSATDSAGRIAYGALSELIPETLDRLEADVQASVDLAVLRALETALALDGTEPVVVAIDDVAAIDLPTCELLVHLATNRRLFIVANQAVDEALPEALRRLTPANVVELELEPLSITATAALAAEVLDGPVGPGLVRNLHDRTRGHPLFVCELLRSATAAQRIRTVAGVHQLVGELEIDPSLGRQLTLRFGMLKQAERDVLELLALAGELGVDDLASVIDLALLEAMERRGLITTFHDRRRFRAAHSHPLHAEAWRADMTPLVRRRRHSELAAIIGAREGRRAEDQVLSAVAGLAGGLDVPVDQQLKATYLALRLDRIEDAANLARSAHDSASSEETRTALAETLVRQGRFVEADELMAEPVPADAGDWPRLRWAIRRSSNRLWGFRDAEEALRIDDECLHQLSDPDAIARVVAHQAWVDYCDGRSEQALARTDHLVDADHPDVRFAVATVRAPALVLCGRIEDGAELAQRAWDNGWGADTEHGSHGQHLIALGFGKLYLGDIDSARFVAEQGIRVCRDNREATPLLFFLDLAGWIELLVGDLPAALSYFEEALDIGTDMAIASAVRSSLAGAVLCHAQLGDAEEAASTHARIRDVPAAPGPRAGAELEAAAAWVAAAGGDTAKAANQLRTAAADAGRRGLRILELLLLLDVARLGYATTEDAESSARATAACQGELAGLVGDAIRALVQRDGAELDGSAARLGEMGFRLWAAELAATAADAWAAAGEQRAATASQRTSDKDRGRLPGAWTPSLARARSVAPLTRREREIAALAATGVRNSEIAERIHVSVRTVETHLHRIYRKLGINGRGELADALDAPGR